jgi:serine/threonine-protein kinase
MSPEQCSQAAEIDARSDIYSFGIILFEMLAGHVPFTGESATAIMLKQLQEPPPSVLEERRDLPASVGVVIARALSKRPEDRQQSASELVEALELAASGEPVPASPTATTIADRPFAARDTNRIVVPTSQNEVRGTANQDYDETTVVRANAGARTPTGEHEMFDDVLVEPPPASRFNPWVVIVPAAALLVAVLGIFYVVNSSGGTPQPDANANANAPLAVDPNAQPAQAAQPATGANEANITSAPATAAASPTPALPGADAASTGANANAKPALVEEIKGNRNDNKQDDQRGDQNDNANASPSTSPSTDSSPQHSPTPQSSPKPKPTVRDTGDEPPPPTPRKTATPPPTPPGRGAAPFSCLPTSCDSSAKNGLRASAGTRPSSSMIFSSSVTARSSARRRTFGVAAASAGRLSA